MTLQLPGDRRSLLVDLWTRRLTSCSSLLHRAPFVAGFATKPTKEWPDLFPLSRYVTRKGSGDGPPPRLLHLVWLPPRPCRDRRRRSRRSPSFGLTRAPPRAGGSVHRLVRAVAPWLEACGDHTDTSASSSGPRA